MPPDGWLDAFDTLNASTRNQTGYCYVLYSIADAIGYYLITIVSLLGFCLNLLSIKLLAAISVKHKFYKYLLCKSIWDALICLLGVGYLNSNCAVCNENNINTYWTLFYKVYVIRISLRILVSTSTLCEILLTFNRALSFSTKRNLLNHWSIKCHMLCCLMVPFSVGVPVIFSFQLKPLNQTHMFYWTLTSFGETRFFQCYTLVLLIVEYFIPICLLLILNLIILSKYKRRMRAKLSLSIVATQVIRKSEIRFTKIILIVTGVFVISRALDMMGSLFSRLEYILIINYIVLDKALINLMRQITYLVVLLQYTVNIFIYVSIDPNLLELLNDYCSKLRQVRILICYGLGGLIF